MDNTDREEKKKEKIIINQWMNGIKELRNGAKRDIMARLNTRARVDVFGGDQITFLEGWQGKNKEYNKWRDAGILFICPPVSQLSKMTSIIRFYKLQAIIIFPDWGEEGNQWYNPLWDIVKKYQYYAPSHKIWCGDQPTWGSFAAVVDGASVDDQGDQGDDMYIMAIEAKQQETRSLSRRKRRKKQAQAIKDSKNKKAGKS